MVLVTLQTDTLPVPMSDSKSNKTPLNYAVFNKIPQIKIFHFRNRSLDFRFYSIKKNLSKRNVMHFINT